MRHRKLYLLIGAPKTGKTTFLEKIINDRHVRKILVYDINREKAYRKLPAVNVLKLGDFEKGKRRVIYTDPRKVIEFIVQDYHNGLLILDDVDRYVSQVNMEIQSMLLGHRHLGLDIISVFHSLARVPPVFYENTNIIILKKTSEQPGRAIHKVPNVQKVLDAFQDLQNDPNPYATKTIVCR